MQPKTIAIAGSIERGLIVGHPKWSRSDTKVYGARSLKPTTSASSNNNLSKYAGRHPPFGGFISRWMLGGIMRYELTDHEWTAIKPMLSD
jgi:hypothetical protein